MKSACTFLLLLMSAAAQTGDVVGFMEWVLGIHLTQQERATFESQPLDAAALNTVRQLQTAIHSLPADQRETIRVQAQAAFVQALRQQPANEGSRILLAAYARAQSGGRIPPQLIGSWSQVHASTVTFRNSATGAYGPPSGNGLTFTFFANGEARIDVAFQSTLYGCTMSAFIFDPGRFEIDGGTMRIDTVGGDMDNKDTCRASGNYKKKASPQHFVFNWNIQRDQYGQKLCLTAPGKAEDCYYRK